MSSLSSILDQMERKCKHLEDSTKKNVVTLDFLDLHRMAAAASFLPV